MERMHKERLRLASACCCLFAPCVHVAPNRGPQYMIGIPKMVPLILGNYHIELPLKRSEVLGHQLGGSLGRNLPGLTGVII